MTTKVMEDEITQLKAKLESETFRQTYSENLLQKEQEKLRERDAEIERQKNVILQLTAQLESGEDAKKLNAQELKIDELKKANQQLKTELLTTQQGVGEVMLIANQQAQEMLAEAEKKARLTIEHAKQELLDIGFKASQLAVNVKESQNQVNDVYKELTDHLGALEAKELII